MTGPKINTYHYQFFMPFMAKTRINNQFFKPKKKVPISGFASHIAIDPAAPEGGARQRLKNCVSWFWNKIFRCSSEYNREPHLIEWTYPHYLTKKWRWLDCRYTQNKGHFIITSTNQETCCLVNIFETCELLEHPCSLIMRIGLWKTLVSSDFRYTPRE